MFFLTENVKAETITPVIGGQAFQGLYNNNTYSDWKFSNYGSWYNYYSTSNSFLYPFNHHLQFNLNVETQYFYTINFTFTQQFLNKNYIFTPSIVSNQVVTDFICKETKKENLTSWYSCTGKFKTNGNFQILAQLKAEKSADYIINNGNFIHPDDFYCFYDLSVSYSTDNNSIIIDQNQTIIDQNNNQLNEDKKQHEENKGFFNNIINTIKNLPSLIVDGFVGLFVPSGEELNELLDNFKENITTKLGAIGDVLNLITDFFGNIDWTGTKNSLTFPEVKVMGHTLIEAQPVNVIPQGFEGIQNILKTLVDIILTLAFINMLKHKYEGFVGGNASDY